MIDAHCETCGKPTKVFVSSGKPKRFCSQECRNRNPNRKRSQSKRVEFTCMVCGGHEQHAGQCVNWQCRVATGVRKRKPVECLHCGKTFMPKRSDRIGYCSLRCHVEHNVVRHGLQRDGMTNGMGKHTNVWWCVDCGVLCYASRGRGVRCEACSRKHILANHLINYYRTKKYDSGHITCQECGKVVFKAKRASVTKYCSKECSERELKRASANHRKRARKHGVEYETIKLSELIKRDGGRCQVCGIRVKRSKTHCANRASIGHIIAISNGGPHTWQNVQLECWECNTSHGTSTHGQLRLF